MEAFRPAAELAALRKKALAFLGFDETRTFEAIYNGNDEYYEALEALIGHERAQSYLDTFHYASDAEANQLREEIKQRLESMRIGTYCTPNGVITITPRATSSANTAREIGKHWEKFREGLMRGAAEHDASVQEVASLNALFALDAVTDEKRNGRNNQE